MFNFFKQDIYYAVFNAANCISGYEVDDGIIDFTNAVDESGNPVRVNFVNVENIFAFVDCGPCFREVIVPSNSPIIETKTLQIPNTDDCIEIYNSNYLELGKLFTWTAENIINLINRGADISIGNYKIVKWALLYNFEAFYFLQEYICGRSEELWGEIISKLQQEGLL